MNYYIRRRGKGLLLLKPEHTWDNLGDYSDDCWRPYYTNVPHRAWVFASRELAEGAIFGQTPEVEEVIDEAQVAILYAIRRARARARRGEL
jgi:hypothetical protein